MFIVVQQHFVPSCDICPKQHPTSHKLGVVLAELLSRCWQKHCWAVASMAKQHNFQTVLQHRLWQAVQMTCTVHFNSMAIICAGLPLLIDQSGRHQCRVEQFTVAAHERRCLCRWVPSSLASEAVTCQSEQQGSTWQHACICMHAYVQHNYITIIYARHLASAVQHAIGIWGLNCCHSNEPCAWALCFTQAVVNKFWDDSVQTCPCKHCCKWHINVVTEIACVSSNQRLF